MKLSQPSSNVEDLAEWRLRERSRMETPPGRQYRARRRKQLSLEEQEAIVTMIETTRQTQMDVAHRFRVTTQLVRDLIKEAKKQPEKMKLRKA